MFRLNALSPDVEAHHRTARYIELKVQGYTWLLNEADTQCEDAFQRGGSWNDYVGNLFRATLNYRASAYKYLAIEHKEQGTVWIYFNVVGRFLQRMWERDIDPDDLSQARQCLEEMLKLACLLNKARKLPANVSDVVISRWLLGASPNDLAGTRLLDPERYLQAVQNRPPQADAERLEGQAVPPVENMPLRIQYQNPLDNERREGRRQENGNSPPRSFSSQGGIPNTIQQWKWGYEIKFPVQLLQGENFVALYTNVEHVRRTDRGYVPYRNDGLSMTCVDGANAYVVIGTMVVFYKVDVTDSSG